MNGPQDVELGDEVPLGTSSSPRRRDLLTARHVRLLAPSVNRVGNICALVAFMTFSWLAFTTLFRPLLAITLSAQDAPYPELLPPAHVFPIACHSHNDYWRAIPLYSALLAGCSSVEADVWHLPASPGPLYVGHSRNSLTPANTFDSLYLDPIEKMLMRTNGDEGETRPARPLDRWKKGARKYLRRKKKKMEEIEKRPWKGVFTANPGSTLTLLVDFKTSHESTWSRVNTTLDRFREQNWLTKVVNEVIMLGPLTVVVSGSAKLEGVLSLPTRDIFFDAPLADVDSNPAGLSFGYNVTNSWYASTPLQPILDEAGSKTSLQGTAEEVVKQQISKAKQRRLKTRYWETPAQPVSARNLIWKTLWNDGAAVINVDNLDAFIHNWDP